MNELQFCAINIQLVVLFDFFTKCDLERILNINIVCKNLVSLLLIIPALAFAGAPDFENGKWVNNLSYNSGNTFSEGSGYTDKLVQVFTPTDPGKNKAWARVTLTTDSGDPIYDGTTGETSSTIHKEVMALKLRGKQYKGLLMLAAKMPAEWPAYVARPTDCDVQIADYSGYEHVSFQGHTQSLVSYDYSGYCRGQNELISPAMESLSSKLAEIRDNVLQSGIWIE